MIEIFINGWNNEFKDKCAILSNLMTVCAWILTYRLFIYSISTQIKLQNMSRFEKYLMRGWTWDKMCVFFLFFCIFWVRPTNLFDGEVINEVVVVLIEAAVQGYTVRVDEQVLQGGHALQAQWALHAVGQIGVVEDHAKTKGLRPQSHRLANTPWKATRSEVSKSNCGSFIEAKIDICLDWKILLKHKRRRFPSKRVSIRSSPFL